MKIIYKINLLILISILALVSISLISSGVKKQELKFYILAEDVKKLQVDVLNALVHEKNFEKTYKDDTLVYTSLDKAYNRLNKIDADLLLDTGKTAKIENLLTQFKGSFANIVLNSNELLSIKEKINTLAHNYSKEHLKADKKILRMIADTFLYEDMNITALQELKNTSLTAFSYISEIIILVNQDLILGGDIKGFDKKSRSVLVKLNTQEKNLRYQVEALKEKAYTPLSKQLTFTYKGLEQEIPNLRNSFIKTQEISKQLQETENQISAIIESITQLSEKLRVEKSRRASILQILGQIIIIGLLLLGGVKLGRSITTPLSLLTRATKAMQPDSDAMMQDPKKNGLKIDTTRNDELGQLGKSFSIMRDAIQQKIDDLEILNKKIERQNLELLRVDKLKSQILDNTSHELRTPLNGIIGIAESMIDGIAGEMGKEANKNLSIIASSGRRLSHLVNDILDFSKLGQKQIELKTSTFHIEDLAQIVLTISEPLVAGKELVLTNDIDSELPLVNADENRVQQILYNLVGNAIKFTSKGEVKLYAKKKKNVLEISVSDNGIGIPEDKLDRIFEAFEQADGSTEREFGGTGLGLSITKKLVEIHEGTIWVESVVGEGSTFTFSLPISECESSDRKQTRLLQPLLSTAQIVDSDPTIDSDFSDQNNFHILVVDDEPVNLRAVTNQLILQKYKVSSASTGMDALDLIDRKGKPDLILLDIMMPKMSGYDVCRKIRQTHTAAELPIIMLTAKNLVSDLVLGFKSGANDYLTKPFSKEELLARIQGHLSLSQLMAEQKRIETALRESQDKYMLLVENANEAIFVLQNGVIQFPNPKTLEYLERTFEELGDIPFFEFIHEDDRDNAMDRYEKRIAGEEITMMNTFRLINKSGEQLWVQANSVRILWDKQPATLNFLRDITIIKKMETRFIQSSKLEAIGTLAGGIAHDFNNILFPILGYTDMLKKDLGDNPVYKKRLDSISRASLRAKDLVQQILTFSSRGNQELSVLQVVPVVKESIDFLRSSVPSAIEFKVDIDEDCPAIMGNETQIEQMVMNLGINACHAMEKTGGIFKIHLGRVDLSADDQRLGNLKCGEYLNLIVSDTGVGMTKDIIKNIFDPYYTTKEEGKGTGLGLSVVHGIVESHKGEIKVNSEPRIGSQFHILIPTADNYEISPESVSKNILPEGTEHILLVDDEQDIVSSLQDMMQSLGYIVTGFTDSRTAFDTFSLNPDQYDLVISDMMMPQMTGKQLAKKIIKIKKDIPIIICSGFSNEKTKGTLEQAGIKAFLQKPVMMNDLATTVRHLLDENILTQQSLGSL